MAILSLLWPRKGYFRHQRHKILNFKTEKKVMVLERELYFENTVLATWKESQAKELQSHQGGQKHLDRRPPEDNNNCLIFRKTQIQIHVAGIVAKASHLNLGLAPINCCDPHDR